MKNNIRYFANRKTSPSCHATSGYARHPSKGGETLPVASPQVASHHPSFGGEFCLGIESSCDETAAAIVSSDGQILSHVIYSQIPEHQKYGGVVPELAARAHILAIDSVVQKTLDDAGKTINDIDVIAATAGPGLIGGVIVGWEFAVGLATATNKPLVPVNHLAAHALVPRLTNDVKFPYLLLLASGGHTQILLVHEADKFELIGETIDDSAGEAFDKVAKMLGLEYPGGPIVDKLAQAGDKKAYKFPRPLCDKPNCDFSFSGIKTAVRTVLQDVGSPLEEGCHGGECRRGGCRLTLPQNKYLLKRASELRKAGSLPEALLWKEIKGKKINGLNFDRQKVIGNYIVDFFCPYLNLVIEIDDKTHDYKMDYDKERDDYLRGLGLDVLHFSVKDILKDMNNVLECIKNRHPVALPQVASRHPSSRGEPASRAQEDICASFQQTVVDVVLNRLNNAINDSRVKKAAPKTLVVAGGVAANSGIRAGLTDFAEKNSMEFVAPPISLCTDNGAMIAWCGIENFKLGNVVVEPFAPRPRWPLCE